jgi:hypothetical protein
MTRREMLVLSGFVIGLFALGTASSIAADKPGKSIDMFKSYGTAGQTVKWVAFSEDPKKKLTDVWEIRDGVIICRGTPLGYIRTEKDYTNLILTLEWRRPAGKKPGRGGVLIRTTGKDQIWPKSLEAQLNAGGAGDFWGLIGYRLSGPEDRMKTIEHDQFGTLTNVAKSKDVEKPVGEWNTYKIVAKGGAVTLSINGHTVNEATDCEIVPGKICLTSEGDEIHFRNVRLQVLPN